MGPRQFVRRAVRKNGPWDRLLVRLSQVNASPDAIVAKLPSSAPTGQPQTSLGLSDQRERRPGSQSCRHALSPERAKQSWEGWASHCAALSGLAEHGGLDSQGVALGWYVGAPSGRKQGAFLGRVRSVIRTLALVMGDFRSGGPACQFRSKRQAGSLSHGFDLLAIIRRNLDRLQRPIGAANTARGL